jgi:aminoglycoside 3-N-acetyltransferase I
MATLRVDRLGPRDVATARALNAMFGEAFEDASAYGGDPPDDRALAATLAKEHVVALVARADGAVVGGLVAYALDKLERAVREFYIYDLAVAEAYRRRGVATALIGFLQDLAAQAGGSVIFVQADYGDDPAIALYEKLGAREEVLHFDIAVGGEDAGG